MTNENTFAASGLFETQGPGGTITGTTGPTEYFNFTHKECGERINFVKFVNLEESWYRQVEGNESKRVPFWVGKFEMNCPKCKQQFVIKMSFSERF